MEAQILNHFRLCRSQDFVRLPWQNQSSQSPNAVPAGPSTSSGSGGVSRAYMAGSGQMNPSLYSSGVVNAGISAVPQPLEISDEIDTSSQLNRFSPFAH